MEIPERLKTVCSFLDALSCHSTPFRRHISQLQEIIHNAALGKRDSCTFIEVEEVQNEAPLCRRSYEDASALLMSAMLCNNCFSLQNGMLGQHNSLFERTAAAFPSRPKAAGPTPAKLLQWALYCDVRAGAALLFTINIQLSCPPTEYLIYVL